jgi:hypothetical protein
VSKELKKKFNGYAHVQFSHPISGTNKMAIRTGFAKVKRGLKAC